MLRSGKAILAKQPGVSNNREDIRISPIKASARVEVPPSPNAVAQEFQASISDISASGCCLTIPDFAMLEVGARIRVHLELLNPAILVTCRVLGVK
jgi:hypothetical protein